MMKNADHSKLKAQNPIRTPTANEDENTQSAVRAITYPPFSEDCFGSKMKVIWDPGMLGTKVPIS